MDDLGAFGWDVVFNLVLCMGNASCGRKRNSVGRLRFSKNHSSYNDCLIDVAKVLGVK
jgi:hypothetical protein